MGQTVFYDVFKIVLNLNENSLLVLEISRAERFNRYLLQQVLIFEADYLGFDEQSFTDNDRDFELSSSDLEENGDINEQSVEVQQVTVHVVPFETAIENIQVQQSYAQLTTETFTHPEQSTEEQLTETHETEESSIADPDLVPSVTEGHSAGAPDTAQPQESQDDMATGISDSGYGDLSMPRPHPDFLRPHAVTETIDSPPSTPSRVIADDLDLDLFFQEPDDGEPEATAIIPVTTLQSIASIQTKPGLNVHAPPFVPLASVSTSILYHTPTTLTQHRYAVSDR